MAMSRVDVLRKLLQAHGVLGGTEIARRLGVSQPTVSRLLAALGDEVVRMGRARATRYALARELRGAGSRWPLYRIAPDGRAVRLGELRALHRGAFHLDAERELPALLHDAFAAGQFPGLPWFLDDLRPQGFLGRAFAQRVGEDMGAPRDPLHWRDEDVVLSLLRFGDDLPGDLVLGELALQRALAWLASPSGDVETQERSARYPALAEAALRGEPVGSSAGGEQPKFALTLTTPEGLRAVIVKFSGADDSAAARRWADLLCCEHLAGEVLRAHGRPAAHSALLDAGGRRFLESTRFDRTASGRRGFVSLAALDAAFHGHGRIDWWRYAAQLQREGWLSGEDAGHLRIFGLFGDLIGNHDMHLGNVGVHLADARPLALAPAYDMLPMRFRPEASGEVVERGLPLAPPLPEQREDWHIAAALAREFWRRVAEDERISEGFRPMALAAIAGIERIARHA